MESNQSVARQRVPWNKGKLVGQKAPFKPKDVWAIRARLERERSTRELALFDLGIDSKLRGCDLVALKVRDAFECSGRTFMGISTEAPIYAAIAGASAGNVVDFRGRRLQVEAVE